MPRVNKIPSYCRHKATGQAYVTIDGREQYLGKYGSPESQEKHARVVAERVQHQEDVPVSMVTLTVGQGFSLQVFTRGSAKWPNTYSSKVPWLYLIATLR